MIKKIYSTISSKNFLFFLKEIEYRRNIKLLNREEKIENFSIIVSCVGNGKNGDLLSESKLASIEYDTMYEDFDE